MELFTFEGTKTDGPPPDDFTLDDGEDEDKDEVDREGILLFAAELDGEIAAALELLSLLMLDPGDGRDTDDTYRPRTALELDIFETTLGEP